MQSLLIICIRVCFWPSIRPSAFFTYFNSKPQINLLLTQLVLNSTNWKSYAMRAVSSFLKAILVKPSAISLHLCWLLVTLHVYASTMFHDRSNSFTNFARYISNWDFPLHINHIRLLSFLVVSRISPSTWVQPSFKTWNLRTEYMQCHNFCVFKTRGQNNQLPTLRKQTFPLSQQREFCCRTVSRW